MSKASLFFLCLATVLSLSACSTAEQKPVWTVKASTASQQKIWVTKADGSVQCSKKPGFSPDFASRQLKAAGVIVFQSRKGTDGQMRAQKCGEPTGNTAEVEISRVDLRKALEQGYVSKETVQQ